MVGRFVGFEETPVGNALKQLTEGNDRLVEFKAFSREGFPAVTALVSEVAGLLEQHGILDAKSRNFAKQSVGAFVAEVMNSAGYEKMGQRAVPGKTFSVGALWKRRGD